MRKYISTNNALNRGRPLSQAVRHGNLVFISGQAAIDPATGELIEGFKDQVIQTIENLLSVLEAAGGKKEDLIKLTVFLNDIGKFEMFNQIYKGYFDTDPPARSCVEVNLVGSFEVEIEGIAIVE